MVAINFKDILLQWYTLNKRDLPWRKTTDPYKIWISEIIFQQTRIEQGKAYYERFIAAFPTIIELADSKEDKVLKLWQGLGYYSRARNLHFTAKIIVNQYNGVFPNKIEDIRKLKGIGGYTAAAIASIAFNLPYPAIDGNVMRFITRFCGIEIAINKAIAVNEVRRFVSANMDTQNPGIFNSAMMEFGALYCKPKNPDCKNCCFNNQCVAFIKNLVGKLPVKAKAVDQRQRFFNYLVITLGETGEKKFYINKRTKKDIWRNLYDFPHIETNHSVNQDKLIETGEWKNIFGNNEYTIIEKTPVYRHILSHQIISAVFWKIQLSKCLISQSNEKLVSADQFNGLPISKLIDNFCIDFPDWLQ